MRIVLLDRASLGEDTPVCKLKSLGELVIYDSTPAHKLAERIADADVIVINKIKITEDILKTAKDLKLICVFATGFDNIDIVVAKKYGVAVCNVPGYSSESVALFTAATVLALYSHIFEYNEFVKNGEYIRLGLPNRLIPVYHELAGKTWGIIGYGGIGKAVARIAGGFGAKVIVNKRTHDPECECVDIDTLCAESDIITIHCPLNEKSRGLINKDRINKMKRDVIIVNEARGAVVNESDVRDAVIEKRIGGYGCDVYSKEPFDKSHPYNDIMLLPNVLLTPHAAWGAYEARERCLNIIIDNINSFIEGKFLNRVDK
ncbi:MAG: hydroxyacid dehydrogenase [Clostridia bacterium]|nr:hydroxyacid dehydrogenase [Clostridia bacterium]